MESFEIRLRDEFTRLVCMEESILDLMQMMQESAAAGSLDPKLVRRMQRLQGRMGDFHRELRLALASSGELLELLDPLPPAGRDRHS